MTSQQIGDLISREETLTAFADYVGSGMSMDDFGALWDIVVKMPPANLWIPVSERLPEESGIYLVTLDYKEHGTGITTLWFHGSLGWDLSAADVVTAWMSLPEPYRTDTESEKDEDVELVEDYEKDCITILIEHLKKNLEKAKEKMK